METSRPLLAEEAAGRGISLVQLPSPIATSTRSCSASSFVRLASLRPLIGAPMVRPFGRRWLNGSMRLDSSFHLLKPVGESGSKTAFDSKNFWMRAALFGV